ncbi:MAG: HTTM domain-containing protein [Myxococcota bacterium]
MIAALWTHWVRLLDRREAPDVLALVRIGVAAVLLSDYLTVWRLGLVPALMAGADAGGLAHASGNPWADWIGADLRGAWLLEAGLVGASAALMVGLGSRAAAVALMLLSTQWAMLLPEGDRAIDMLLRNVLLVLAFSRAGATWSVDARLRTGSWRGDGAPVPAWPRYVLVLQVVVMYFTAGVQKYGQHWWPWGGYSGLYVILHDWSYASHAFGWIRHQPFFLGTQLATAVTMLWQWTYPVVLVHYFPPRRPGRFAAAFERWHLHWAWIAVGAFFHVGIAVTMQLGIFPWGMLAVYPAFLHPDELRGLWGRVRAATAR